MENESNKAEPNKSEPSTSGAMINPEDPDSDESGSDDYEVPDVTISENITENYENELEDDLSKSAKPSASEGEKVPKLRKPISKIPAHLKGLMGEANLRFARGDHLVAEKMCYELIRQVPLAYEPYLTLSQLYENSLEKSMQYLTIAAHLKPQDANQWIRLAQIHLDGNNLRQAITCYNRAIRATPDNIELQTKRIQILEKLNDTTYIRRCKIKLLQSLTPNYSSEMLQLSKELAEQYHQEKDYQKAIEVISIPFEKCPKEISPEMINIYLELLLLSKQYPKCIDLFVQYCNIEIEIILDEDNKITVESYNMPETIQIDLRIKFIICLIHLDSFHLLNKLLEPLLVEDNVEYIGDLYLDVAENLMSVNHHADALKLLVPLIKSDNFSLAAVWLKYAECLQACEMYDQAVESYFNVIKMAPQHIEVRYPLSNLLLQMNKVEDALNVLSQDYSLPELDVGLLIKKIELCKKLKDFDGYFKSVEILLLRHCIEIKDFSEIMVVSFLDRTDKVNRLKKLRALRGETYEPNEKKSLREPSVDEEYALFKEALDECFQQKKYALLQKLTFTALSSTRFKSQYNDLNVYALFACIYNHDNIHGYAIIRDLVLRNTTNNLIWNLWNLMVQHLEESRHIRFIVRQGRILHMPHLKLLEANNALCAGSYKIAIMILMPLLKENPTPFMTLLTGIVFLQLSQQKIGSRKKHITPTVYSLFLHYSNMRGKDAKHEVYYNLGRMYHKYGVLHIAAHYYNLVLETKHPLIDKYPQILSLQKEAAFNLFLIYKDCNNSVGCKNLLLKYLTI